MIIEILVMFGVIALVAVPLFYVIRDELKQ
jgi:hypothetical protein